MICSSSDEVWVQFSSLCTYCTMYSSSSFLFLPYPIAISKCTLRLQTCRQTTEQHHDLQMTYPFSSMVRTGDSKCRIPFQCVDTALYAPIWYSKLFPSAPVGSSHHWRSCPTGLGSLLLQFWFSSIMLCPVSHSHQEQNFFKNGENKIKEP